MVLFLGFGLMVCVRGFLGGPFSCWLAFGDVSAVFGGEGFGNVQSFNQKARPWGCCDAACGKSCVCVECRW